MDDIELLFGTNKYIVSLVLYPKDGIGVIFPTLGSSTGVFTLYESPIIIKKLSLTQNTYNNNVLCLKADFSVNVFQSKGRPIDIYMYLVDEDGKMVRTTGDSKYNINGYVAQKLSYSPSYDNSNYTYQFYFPNSVLSSKYGEHPYYLQLLVVDRYKTEARATMGSSWFYIERGGSRTSSSPKPKTSSSSSSSSSYSSSRAVVGAGILLGLAAVAIDALCSSNNTVSSSSTNTSKNSNTFRLSTKKYSPEELPRVLASGNLYALQFIDYDDDPSKVHVLAAKVIKRNDELYISIPEWGIVGKLQHWHSTIFNGGVISMNEGDGDGNWYLMDQDKNIIIY